LSTKPLHFVLDSSVTLSWAFADEQEPGALRAAQILEAETADAFVPAIWWYEIRNILIVGERRGRITPAATGTFLKQIAKLKITRAPNPDESLLLDLARKTNLTGYDASYLALAIEENIPIATLDHALRSAAIAKGVPLLA
jgi:predicted nucleic acid-binding protein